MEENTKEHSNTRFRKIFIGILIFVILVIFSLIFYYQKYILLAFTFLKPDYSKIKSNNGVVSVLILGKGGDGHEAPDLTDTMMLTFVNINKKRVSLLSLPRDIWITELRAKLNSIYFWGKKLNNDGFGLVDESVGKITGQKVNYNVVVDFSLFKDLIDTLGGVEITIDNSFVDNKYPIEGKEDDLCDGDPLLSCRYQTISFEKGIEVMSGDRALVFVRSRNAQGDEGTDLAREARQQKVINAIKQKITSRDFLLNIDNIKKVAPVLSKHIETDISLEEAVVLARLFYDSWDNVSNLSIPEDFLEVSNNNYKYDYLYVFLPKVTDWTELKQWLAEKI